MSNMKPKLGDVLVLQSNSKEGNITADALDHCAKSREAAKRWMREYNRGLAIDAGELSVGADVDFAGPCYLAKIIAIVLPVPVVSVRVEIREEK